MRNLLCFLCGLISVLFIVGSANALPIVEEFGRGMGVAEGQRAIYKFDLTDSGNKARVKEGTTLVRRARLTEDASGFDPTEDIISASLELMIGGWDRGELPKPDEHIKIIVRGDGFSREVLFNEIVSLGLDTYSFSILPEWLSDGELKVIVAAPAVNDRVAPDLNDFRVRYARLSVETNPVSLSETNPAPVPEPSTMLLIGTGLVGLAAFSRRKCRK